MLRIYCSQAMPEGIKELFREFGEVCPIPSFSSLPKQIDSHADILLFYDRDRLYLPKEYYNSAPELFEFGGQVVKIDDEFSCDYSHHVYLDCFTLLGVRLVACGKLTARALVLEYPIINVNQGYARCSTLKLGEDAIISADRGICKAARELGCGVLEISPGGILLEGYSCGFIGGASAVICDTVIFFGDVTRHPDWERIREFINQYNMKIVCDSSMPLTDYGSAVAVQVYRKEKK